MAADKDEAKGSHHVSTRFLKKFYVDAYKRLRRILPEEKVIVFHDGFRLVYGKTFFVKAAYEKRNAGYSYLYSGNGGCDAHPQILGISGIYHIISASSVEKSTDIIHQFSVGEWCVCNELADKKKRNMK